MTPITPYTQALPSSEDPASFDARATTLLSWIVSNFAPQITALSGEIEAAMDGSETVLTAVADFAATLGDMAEMDLADRIGTQSQWDGANGTLERLISPQKLHAKIESFLSAGLTSGSDTVGTLAFLGTATAASIGGDVAFGAVLAGSNLYSASVTGDSGTQGNGQVVTTSGSAMSGTWRCLGFLKDPAGNSGLDCATLFVRIS